jgi:hypothetical protein
VTTFYTNTGTIVDISPSYILICATIMEIFLQKDTQTDTQTHGNRTDGAAQIVVLD